MAMEQATLGGGCFWCLEACFEQLKGVQSVVSGYTGGDPTRANYKAVCSGNTGHAEVVQITFDNAEITFMELLELFFTIHDPTTLNRQGADEGTQYRSEIFAHSENQLNAAHDFIRVLTAGRAFPAPIVTKVSLLDRFFPAEAYHQGYFRTNPDQPYCTAVVGPKATRTRLKFATRLK